jgi:predicted PurR-regulated permease PerM
MTESASSPTKSTLASISDRRRLGDLARLATITLTVLLIALCWYLLKELALLFRPLFLAVFLAYIIVPLQLQVRKYSRGLFARFALLAFVIFILSMLYLIIYRNVVDLTNSMPELSKRAQALMDRLNDFVRGRWAGLADAADPFANVTQQWVETLKESAGSLLNYTTGVFLEAIEVCFYLIFIMLEAGRLPERIRVSFADERAAKILEVIASINQAMANFLHVKVRASLILAVPICAVLWAMGIRFVFLWGLLFFLGNFIPYIGSFAAWAIVSAYGLLQLDFGWQPIALTVMLLVLRTLAADIIEPSITGKVINLSPIVILLSLSFWSLCWGPSGMVLAVPLAVMLKIIMLHLPGTKPFADLMSEE